MSLGLLIRASSGWCRLIRIGDQGVLLVAWGLLGRASSRWRMSLGLLIRASRGWRRVIGIADQGVVWVALCHWDC